jgi:hypothetical protein
MDLSPTGIAIPIVFSTDRASRQGSMWIYFSPKAMKPDQDTPTSVKAWQKEEQLYRKHHIYGDHQFLVPVRSEVIPNVMTSPRYLTSNMPVLMGQIGKDPATAVANRTLQLLPCSQSNLELIRPLQKEPFYIEIGKRSFHLHVWDQGSYWKIPSQRQMPICPAPKSTFCRPHPVITVHTNAGPIEFMSLRDIPWPLIARQLGIQETTPVGCRPLITKYN